MRVIITQFTNMTHFSVIAVYESWTVTEETGCKMATNPLIYLFPEGC